MPNDRERQDARDGLADKREDAADLREEAADLRETQADRREVHPKEPRFTGERETWGDERTAWGGEREAWGEARLRPVAPATTLREELTALRRAVEALTTRLDAVADTANNTAGRVGVILGLGAALAALVIGAWNVSRIDNNKATIKANSAFIFQLCTSNKKQDESLAVLVRLSLERDRILFRKTGRPSPTILAYESFLKGVEKADCPPPAL